MQLGGPLSGTEAIVRSSPDGREIPADWKLTTVGVVSVWADFPKGYTPNAKADWASYVGLSFDTPSGPEFRSESLTISDGQVTQMNYISDQFVGRIVSTGPAIGTAQAFALLQQYREQAGLDTKKAPKNLSLAQSFQQTEPYWHFNVPSQTNFLVNAVTGKVS